eukprot:1148021-Pelagomonas_calceolata.AAC.1
MHMCNSKGRVRWQSQGHVLNSGANKTAAHRFAAGVCFRQKTWFPEDVDYSRNGCARAWRGKERKDRGDQKMVACIKKGHPTSKAARVSPKRI